VSGGGDDRPGDLPLLEPEQFAELVRQATDEQLREGLAANGELILGEIFRRIPEQFDARRAASVDAVVEWRVRSSTGGDDFERQLVMSGGRCTLVEAPGENATVTYEIDDVDFIRLITGGESGPKLFLYGRLRVRGNLILAARMPSLFRMPGSPEGR
jgi:putative sterol carrier protein